MIIIIGVKGMHQSPSNKTFLLIAKYRGAAFLFFMKHVRNIMLYLKKHNISDIDIKVNIITLLAMSFLNFLCIRYYSLNL